ncbi:MAG: hypothetical protein K2J77_07500 [Oscillospiraceae bacterium]|nr:hypothetical protein [Oscillospiraceae bacterium]
MVKSSFLFAWEQYKSWLISPRILLAVYITIFINENITKKMLAICTEVGYKINLAEPLALIFSKSIYTVIIPIVFIALMTDFPRTEGSVFYVYRMSRKSWVLGELLFAAASSLTYVISLVLGTLLYCAGKCDLSNTWSDFTTKLYLDYPDIYAQSTSLAVESSVYTQGKPLEVILHSMALIFLYTMILSLVIMLFKLLNRGEIGIISAVAITLFGLATDSGASKVMWAFPITHTVFGWHYDRFFRAQNFTILGSYIYLAALLVALVILNFIVSKKVRFS